MADAHYRPMLVSISGGNTNLIEGVDRVITIRVRSVDRPGSVFEIAMTPESFGRAISGMAENPCHVWERNAS